MNIKLTRKPDRATITIDASLIDYLKPALGECEIHFVDGGSVVVLEDEKEIGRRIRNTN